MVNGPVFAVTADFHHVDACIEAGRMTLAAHDPDRAAASWSRALEMNQAILGHAGVEVSNLAPLIRAGLSGQVLPENASGFLARKALRSATEPGFAPFVEEVRRSVGTIVSEAAELAGAYLPCASEEKRSSLRVTARFAAFAFADAFSSGDGIVVNLGDLFFGVWAKIPANESVRTHKTLHLVRRLIAHELHHIGMRQFMTFPAAHNGEWLQRFVISEGVATTLMLPFTEDDGYWHGHWTRHTGRFERYVWDLADALAVSPDRMPPDVWDKWVMNVGAAYYVGATMTQAIDRASGRDCLLEAIAGGPRMFFASYNRAARKWRLPTLIWSE